VLTAKTTLDERLDARIDKATKKLLARKTLISALPINGNREAVMLDLSARTCVSIKIARPKQCK
jgi:hypothetical protein